MSKEAKAVLEDTLIALGILAFLVGIVLCFMWGGIVSWPLIKVQVLRIYDDTHVCFRGPCSRV